MTVSCPNQIEKMLKLEMKWNRSKIDIAINYEIVSRHRHFIGGSDGMPNVCGLIVSHLDAIRATPQRNRNVATAGHRFDGGALLFATVRLIYAKMNLPIHGHGVGEERRPIDTPVEENRPRITRDRNQNRCTTNWRQRNMIKSSNDLIRLDFRADNRSHRNAKVIRGFRRAPASFGFFSRHRVPDSQVGANYVKANCKEWRNFMSCGFQVARCKLN